MFFKSPCSTGVQNAIEADQVSHGGHCVVQKHVHAFRMNCFNRQPPCNNAAKMMVQERVIQRAVLIGALTWISQNAS